MYQLDQYASKGFGLLVYCHQKSRNIQTVNPFFHQLSFFQVLGAINDH
jgi:hypothetical protein